MRVAGNSNVKNVALCLVRFLENPETPGVELRAIGAGAVNQAVKSIACARGLLGQQGYDLCVRIGFCNVNEHEGSEEKTAMRFIAFIKDVRGGYHGHSILDQ